MDTRVVNLRNSGYDVYIGRAGKGEQGYFGNPHTVGYCKLCRKTHDREGAISEYVKYFLERVQTDAEFRRRVLALEGKRLGCFCAPLPCHGDIIIRWLDESPPE